MKMPVFILGCHKSGTSLLRSLLDNTPGLFPIPIEAHVFEHLGFWVDYELRRQIPTEFTFDQVVTHIKEMAAASNQKADPKHSLGGDSIAAGRWNVELLVEHLSSHGREAFEQKDYRAFMDAYFEAIYLALHQKLPAPSIRFVEKTVENAEFVMYLKQYYPDARFIHIVRNPYATLVAARKFRTSRKRYPYLGTILSSLENSYYYAYHNPMMVENYHLIRYEDLLQEPEKNMRQIAAFIDVPFDPKMLTPSTVGKDWKGNSMSGVGFEGISTLPIDSWKKEILPLETSLINILLPHVLTKFAYERHTPAASPYLPCKGESIPMYFANRFFYLTSKNRRSTSMNS